MDLLLGQIPKNLGYRLQSLLRILYLLVVMLNSKNKWNFFHDTLILHNFSWYTLHKGFISTVYFYMRNSSVYGNLYIFLHCLLLNDFMGTGFIWITNLYNKIHSQWTKMFSINSLKIWSKDCLFTELSMSSHETCPSKLWILSWIIYIKFFQKLPITMNSVS